MAVLSLHFFYPILSPLFPSFPYVGSHSLSALANTEPILLSNFLLWNPGLTDLFFFYITNVKSIPFCNCLVGADSYTQLWKNPCRQTCPKDSSLNRGNTHWVCSLLKACFHFFDIFNTLHGYDHIDFKRICIKLARSWICHNPIHSKTWQASTIFNLGFLLLPHPSSLKEPSKPSFRTGFERCLDVSLCTDLF